VVGAIAITMNNVGEDGACCHRGMLSQGPCSKIFQIFSVLTSSECVFTTSR